MLIFASLQPDTRREVLLQPRALPTTHMYALPMQDNTAMCASAVAQLRAWYTAKRLNSQVVCCGGGPGGTRGVRPSGGVSAPAPCHDEVAPHLHLSCPHTGHMSHHQGAAGTAFNGVAGEAHFKPHVSTGRCHSEPIAQGKADACSNPSHSKIQKRPLYTQRPCQTASSSLP